VYRKQEKKWYFTFLQYCTVNKEALSVQTTHIEASKSFFYLAASLQDSDSSELLQRRRQLLRAASDDAVKVDWMLRDLNLLKKLILMFQQFNSLSRD